MTTHLPPDEYEPTAGFYDHVTPYRDRTTDVSFYVEEARASGGPVLELGCGTGRVLLPTARAGVAATGVDLSPSMLCVCREKLEAEPAEVRARVRLVEGDMRSLDLGETFALVTLPFRPFQHLISVEDQLACLDAVRRHLGPGGRLVFDLFNPSLHALVDDARLGETGEEPEFVTPLGERVVRKHRMAARDWLGQVVQAELIYYVTAADGSTDRRVHRFPMRYLFRFEVEHLLARAGLQVLEVLGDFDRTPYGTKYPGELIFVAQRKE